MAVASRSGMPDCFRKVERAAILYEAKVLTMLAIGTGLHPTDLGVDSEPPTRYDKE
jgi:hypothetical protein